MTGCGMPANWLKTSGGFLARAPLPSQRTARVKRHHGSLRDPAPCNLLNSFPTRSTWWHPLLFAGRLQLRNRSNDSSRCCLRRSELDNPEIANRSVEHCLGSPAFEAVAALRSTKRAGFRAPRFKLSCLRRSRQIFKIEPETGQFGTISPRSREFGRLRSQAFRSTSSTSRLILRSLRMRLRTKDRYPCPQVRLRPRLLAVTISTHR